LPLFENIKDRTVLNLRKTKTFSGGAVTLYYEPTNEKTTNRLQGVFCYAGFRIYPPM